MSPKWYISFRFSDKNVIGMCIFRLSYAWPAHVILLDLIALIIFADES